MIPLKDDLLNKEQSIINEGFIINDGTEDKRNIFSSLNKNAIFNKHIGLFKKSMTPIIGKTGKNHDDENISLFNRDSEKRLPIIRNKTHTNTNCDNSSLKNLENDTSYNIPGGDVDCEIYSQKYSNFKNKLGNISGDKLSSSKSKRFYMRDKGAGITRASQKQLTA